MRSAIILFSLAASAVAYQITSPSESTDWTNSGSQTVAWDMVSTDASNFTIVLVTNGNSNQAQVLKAFQLGSEGSTTVEAPSGGWPTGTDFQINLVQDEDHLSSIYAQSGQFDITTASSSSAASSGSLVSNTGTTVVATATNAGNSVRPVSATATTTPTGSETSTPSDNAALPLGVQTGALGLVAFLGAFLA